MYTPFGIWISMDVDDEKLSSSKSPHHRDVVPNVIYDMLSDYNAVHSSSTDGLMCVVRSTSGVVGRAAMSET